MPTIGYSAPIQLLVAVRGHPFDRTAFDAIFQGLEGISATMVDQPAAARLMNPDGMRGFDALVLYDMPGLDFAASPAPRLVAPDPGFQAGFEALLDQGCGVLALHHALAGWPAWPGYGELLGGAFLYRPAALRGAARPDSGYRHDVDYEACVLAEHQVTAGLPARFALRDELYLAEIYAEDVTPLLRADTPFTQDRFHSAAAAMDGRMYDNEGWAHPPGSDLIGWVKRARNSPLVYLQPGDGPSAYENPHYKRLIENAIRWLVTPQARAWGRGA